MKRLTVKLVDAINRPGKYHDGDAGLYLYVQERNGRLRKSYVQRVTVHGTRVEIGLGSTKWTTPSEARAAARANRKIARTGSDPRRRQQTMPTFEEAADAVIAMHATTWKDGGKTEKRWRAILAKYAFPRLGGKPVSAVTTADVLAVLTTYNRDAPEHSLCQVRPGSNQMALQSAIRNSRAPLHQRTVEKRDGGACPTFGHFMLCPPAQRRFRRVSKRRHIALLEAPDNLVPRREPLLGPAQTDKERTLVDESLCDCNQSS